MGLFGRRPAAEVEPPLPLSDEASALVQLEQLQQTTAEVEAAKEERRLAREERKFLKAHQRKQQQRERLVAPILLVLTMIISFLLMVWSGK